MNRDKLFAIFWSLSLFLVVFLIFSSPIKPRDYKNLIYLILCISSLSLFGFNKINTRTMLAFIPIGILSVVNQHHFLAMTPLVQCFFIMSSFGLFNQFFCKWSPQVKNIIYNSLGAACLLQCIWVIVNWLGMDPYSIITGNHQKLIKTGKIIYNDFPIVGSLGHWMVTGSFLVVTAPFLFRLSPILTPVLAFACFVLPSGIPPVGLGFIAICLLMDRFGKKPYFWMGAIAFSLLFYYILEPYGVFNPSERIKIWVTSLDFVNNPIIGHGQGYFQDAFSQVYEGQFGENHSHPHNEFVYIYSSFGIIGLLLTSYLGYEIIKRRKVDMYAYSSLCGFFVTALFGFPFHISSIALVGIISLASILNRSHNINKREFL